MTLPISAEVHGGRTRFRVWAPSRRRVTLVIEGRAPIALDEDQAGYFAAEVADAPHGTRYGYRLDDDPKLYPDPASRAQPDGPHGPSMVIDPRRYRWKDAAWRGARLEGQVIYELHVGTFTKEGTWAAAADRLPELAAIGVTTVEMMPVADFPGRFGWGYDGVALFAPYHGYGEPDDLRRFVERAHELGLAVILDVVYNHIGPDGNYLGAYAKEYFTEKHPTEWGPALNYDGERSGPVRDFFVANAAYWVREYHFDGLRFDATQCIFDDSDQREGGEHVLAAMTRAAREAAGGRHVILTAENESQTARLVRAPAARGHGFDAVWNDDYHHSALVALTGRTEAYYHDYTGQARELVAAIKWGYLYQGQRYEWQKKRRGTPALDVPPARFSTYLENHDQVSNSARGDRLFTLASPARVRALTALLLLGPGTPLLFQGQEWGTTTPFLFFADHNPELAKLVRAGRADYLAQFPSIKEMRALLDDPGDVATFERCKLDWSERERNGERLAFTKSLLEIRRSDAVLARPRTSLPRDFDAAPLGDDALVLRWFGGKDGDRLLVVNLGKDLAFSPASEPLLAPPEGAAWTARLSTEDARWGGAGAAPIEQDGAWSPTAESATFFVAQEARP